MEYFLNRLDICYNNVLLSKKIEQKELILNRVLGLLQYCRMSLDLINFLHESSDNFIEFINSINKPSLILMTYDLEMIGKSIGLPNNLFIAYYNNLFHIDYKVLSPLSSHSDNSNSWN